MGLTTIFITNRIHLKLIKLIIVRGTQTHFTK